MDLQDDIRGWSPIQFLTPTDRAGQGEFREGYCEILISSNHQKLFGLGDKGDILLNYELLQLILISQ